MTQYHKIQSLWHRNPDNRNRLIEGRWFLPEFEYLADNTWQWTEKLDGTNIRISWDGDTLRFGGRTDRAQLPVQLVAHLQAKFTPALFDGYPPTTLYGEGVGPGIQKGGGMYGDRQHFVLFDVRVSRGWLDRGTVGGWAENFGVPFAPVALVGNVWDAVRWVKGECRSAWGGAAEGLVGRPKQELRTAAGDRVIVKLKRKDFV